MTDYDRRSFEDADLRAEEAETELSKALAQNALLREALEKIKRLLSAGNIDGATEVHKSVSLNDAWWQTENALSATPADIDDFLHKEARRWAEERFADLRDEFRAEVLEEAAEIVEHHVLLTHFETAKKIRALKDKPDG